MNSRIRAVALGAALLGLLAFGAGTAQAVDPPRALPPADGQFDYQIGGPYTPLSSVRVVSRDRLVSPVDPPGRAVYDVCYINAFQTQPDDITWWEANYPDLLLRGSRGSFVIDGAWGENVLDTRTATKRTRLIAILDSWISNLAVIFPRARYQLCADDQPRRIQSRTHTQTCCSDEYGLRLHASDPTVNQG